MKTGLTILTAVLIQIPALASADLVVERRGRAPSPELKTKSSNVPAFDLIRKQNVNGKTENVRVQNIPRLDIGEEPQLKAGNLTPIALPQSKALQFTGVRELTSPQEIFIDQYLIKEMPQVKAVAEPRQVKAATPVAENLKPQNAPPLALSEPQQQVSEVQEMKPNQMKLLQALIFLEIRKNHSLALGLLAELLEDPELKTEASYHMALTSMHLGLYSEYRYQMLKVLADNNTDWQKKAALSLVQNILAGDLELVSFLDPKLSALGLAPERVDQYNINRAKYYLEKNDLTQALAATDTILMDSPLYTDTLYLKSLILYKGGQLQEAIGLQQSVLAEVMKKQKDSDFRSIVALSLARMHFQAGQHKEAFDNYLKVDKKHPEWVQAMVEQAWSQILASDYEGAAGNMFSLHTDFFKKVFNPESYVVRTVGYLNLCQYGDGAKVVYDMKKRYTPVLEKMTKYEQSKPKDVQYYDTIKSFAQNPNQPEVDGLPREFVFYLTRHPKFLDEQQNINSIEDQISRYNKVTLDIIKMERVYLQKQNSVRAKLVDLRKRMTDDKQKVALEPQSAELEKTLLSYRIEHHIAKKARTAIRDLRTAALKRLDSDKEKTLIAAGKAIKERFTGMFTTLKNTLDQAEVLQYELYSGAGEHIRFQMAGGQIDEKEREQLKITDNSMQWKFKGEVWEDEIGHFRSSLKNVCPPEEVIGAANF